MNRSSGLRNKLIYLAVIIVMLLPLYLLGQPATGQSGDTPGKLNQLRNDFDISEADLGEIDPASESMKLASLGLRGVAATLLWKKSEDYKRHHEWDRLSATLNQIAKLQPHYEAVWEHQAHNLSYNVSAEFDDYTQRYDWVKKGMSFLSEGVRKNRNAPRLIWYTGWFYGQKLGLSDEKRQFRELFREDDPLHAELLEEGIAVDSPEARGPDGRPDNWLVGRLWLNRGYDLVDSGVRLVNKTPLTFFEIGPKWRILHAVAIEEEGTLDDRAKDAWQRAGDDWYRYGTRSIQTTSPFTIQLAGLEDLRRRRAGLVERFEEAAGETLEKMRQERRDALSDAQLRAIETPAAERTAEQVALAAQAEPTLEPPYFLVAKASPENVQLKALQLAVEIDDVDQRIQKTESYRGQMNYEYWETRTRAEQEDVMIEARRLVYEAEQLNDRADLDGAIAAYDKAWVKWAEVFDRYPVLIEDAASDDLLDSINRYRVATDQSELPDDFPLKTFYEMRTMDEADSEEYARIRQEETDTTPDAPSFDLARPYQGTANAAAESTEAATPEMSEAEPQEEPNAEEATDEPADSEAESEDAESEAPADETEEE
ncbi:IRE (iron responsive element) [Candidatus Laterigemmans baculatus]|uniref:IRE (iron responsive element) n=1 Tax=Candidatus Laterigemmans baculatus TaxID=2770505 RepID=UPI0013DD7DD7|nr:IRE (iron responsive element) [Candidatus Laterigemmans baculatus]